MHAMLHMVRLYQRFFNTKYTSVQFWLTRSTFFFNLTHCGLNKMTHMLPTIFSNAPGLNFFWFKFNWMLLPRAQLASQHWGNSSAPGMRRAIIWTNDDIFPWRTNPSWGLNGFKLLCARRELSFLQVGVTVGRDHFLCVSKPMPARPTRDDWYLLMWNTGPTNVRSQLHLTWWRHDMEMLSALLAMREGNPLVTNKFPSNKGPAIWMFAELRPYFTFCPDNIQSLWVTDTGHLMCQWNTSLNGDCWVSQSE